MRFRLHLFMTLTACAQVKAPVTDDFSDLASLDDKSDAFSAKLKIVGPIADGETKTISYTSTPLYRGLTVSGKAGDVVDVSVTSSAGDPVAWLLDSKYAIVDKNDDADASTSDSHLTATLASDGTYEIVFRDYNKESHRFKVTLSQKGQASGTCAATGGTYGGVKYSAADECRLLAFIDGARYSQMGGLTVASRKVAYDCHETSAGVACDSPRGASPAWTHLASFAAQVTQAALAHANTAAGTWTDDGLHTDTVVNTWTNRASLADVAVTFDRVYIGKALSAATGYACFELRDAPGDSSFLPLCVYGVNADSAPACHDATCLTPYVGTYRWVRGTLRASSWSTGGYRINIDTSGTRAPAGGTPASATLDGFALQYVGSYKGTGAISAVTLGRDGSYTAVVNGGSEHGTFSAAPTTDLPVVFHLTSSAGTGWTALEGHSGYDGVLAATRHVDVPTCDGSGNCDFGAGTVLLDPTTTVGPNESICDASGGQWTDDDPGPGGLYCICDPKVYIPSAGGCVP